MHYRSGRALYSKEELSEIFLAENRITVSESLLNDDKRTEKTKEEKQKWTTGARSNI